MIDENTLRLFAITLWAVGMFFFAVWAAIIALREVFEELYSSRLIRFIEMKIEAFLAIRRYEKERMKFHRFMAGIDEEMVDSKNKGAE